METGKLIALISVVLISGCLSVVDGSQETRFETEQVSVIEVVDGDTVDVRYEGREDTIRLEGVDTPEVHTENDPAEYEGIENTERNMECLRDWGENASRYVKEEIGNENITMKYRVEGESPERGYYGRIIGEILHENNSINRQLVVQGYARSYSEDGPYLEEETEAMQNSAGLWNCNNRS